MESLKWFKELFVGRSESPKNNDSTVKPEPRTSRDGDSGPDKYKEEPSKIFTLERTDSILAAFFSLIIDALPQEQRWIYLTLLLQYRQTFSSRIYPWTYIGIFLSWLFPTIDFQVYIIAMVADNVLRSKYSRVPEDTAFILWAPLRYTLSIICVRLLFDFSDLTPLLEIVLGPSKFWPAAIMPLLPGLLINTPRETINGFVPEGTQGITMAIFAWACIAVIPRYFHLGLWIWFTGPSIVDQPLMGIEWLLCSFIWLSYNIPFQAAYVLHLFINQFPHQESLLRRNGGEASVILQKERRGCVWFAITSFVLRLLEVNLNPISEEIRPLNIPFNLWLPLAVLVGAITYFFRYGMSMRMTKFRHKPLQQPKSFRILRLKAQPCFRNSPVQCDIVHTTIDSPPPFRAVSHRWGSPDEQPQIILLDGAPFLVSEGIHNLLTRLREPRFSQLLWIDSICIDQTNVKEKSQQVGLMRRIFEEAVSTIGWLGDDPRAEKSFKFVERIASVRNIDRDNFLRLTREPSSGWPEFMGLMANTWFDRVWIIQELAVSKKTILRCGDSVFDWNHFASVLARILILSFHSEEEWQLFDNKHLMNTLIMENMRFQVDDVDPLALKDALKVGARFQATLPVDKVFGLLGIIKERKMPLFHPRFERSENFSEETFAKGGDLDDLVENAAILSNVLDAGARRKKLPTRTTRAILNSPSKTLRHINELLDGIDGSFVRFAETVKRPKLEIKPDYAAKTTPEMVYTMVARDLVSNGDVFSFLRYAGIGHSRKPAFKSLPSWVPDWSADTGVYILPHHDRPTLRPARKWSEKGAEKVDEDRCVVRDGGINLLYVKGFVIGRITHATILSEDIAQQKGDDLGVARADIVLQLSKYKEALAIAMEHGRALYESDDNIKEAFFRVLLGGPDPDGGMHTPQDSIKLANFWKQIERLHGLLEKGDEGSTSSGSTLKSSEIPDLHKDLERLSKLHLHKRRVQSSSNSKFAHLMKMDILQSFNQYRWQHQESAGKNANPLQMLNRNNPSILAVYDEYVDYTIGRKFAIVDSGHLCLVPEGASIGDLAIWVEAERLFLIIRPSTLPSDIQTELQKKKGPQDKPQETGGIGGEHNLSDVDESYRLVGEAYIHGVQDNKETATAAADEVNQVWMRLW